MEKASETAQVFLSYSSEDAFEAGLLQFALETLLADRKVKVWGYQRDQALNQQGIADSLKARIRESRAGLMLVSPETLRFGATQWMELAYLDAFDVPRFILLHRVAFADLKAHKKGVPPLLLESQCNPATEWKAVAGALREYV